MSAMCFLSTETNPYINLALEDMLLRDPSIEQACFIYSNRPCVVIGHFQNPWQECNFPLMNKYDIWLVRRQSGGGAVYHDLNSFNYSFIGDVNSFDQQPLFAILKKFFSTLGLNITKDKFSSLFVEGYKCSGTAFKNIKERKLQHGTVLLKGDALFIQKVLTANNIVLNSKSILSKPAPIRSLSDWGVTDLKVQLIEHFFGIYKSFTNVTADIVKLNKAKLEAMPRDILFSHDDWLYGKSPVATIINESLGLQWEMRKKQVVFANQIITWEDFCHDYILEFANKKALSIDRALSEIKV